MTEEDAIAALRNDLGVGDQAFGDTDVRRQGEQVDAIKHEIARLRETVATIASRASELATAKAETTMTDVEDALKRNVFMSVGVALAIGYVWGRSR